MIELHSKSSDDTQEIAKLIADVLQPGDLLLASGDLGAGKTTFTQGLGAGLGVTDRITSPTFVLVNSYEGRLPLCHGDLYRLDQLQEIVDLGLFEMLDDGGVALLEWGEAAIPVMSNDYLAVHIFLSEDENKRSLKLDPHGQRWQARDKMLRDKLSSFLVESASA